MAAGAAITGSAKAPLVEVFDSIQGEGRHVGRPTTFVRVATCPLRCLYCDTPNSYTAPGSVPVRLAGSELALPNPVAVDTLAELLAAARVPRLVSLTGGEPLVFPEFASVLGRLVRRLGGELMLETAALDPEALGRCARDIAHLSADYKLPETLGAPVGGPPPDADGGYAERHVRCLAIALSAGATADCKIVLTAAVTDSAFERALVNLRPLRERLVLVLQPVTPFGAIATPLPPTELRRHLDAALAAGFDVRVLPQVHKTLALP
ncbi:MAG: 7-carboxy-7-deazaguanine synthase QueE [Planctomycetes bacterium]|nr:7-carboxy-7-deazaguanine synthase QueE [Planctomycetota bacterium]